jgi:hypothetical protein
MGPARVSDLAAERERLRELGVDLWPRLRVMTDYSVEIRLDHTPRSIDTCGVSASRIGGGSVASASIAIKRWPSRVHP